MVYLQPEIQLFEVGRFFHDSDSLLSSTSVSVRNRVRLRVGGKA